MNPFRNESLFESWTTAVRTALIIIPVLAHGAPDMNRVKVPDGFQATLFAAPPDIGYPACLAVSPTGELFVGIDENGSLDREPKRGRIVRCVDTDHDGRADRFTTVVPDIDSPRGIIWDRDRLYVLHPPNLTAFIDEDGDGVPDRAEILVEGIGFDLGFRGADHTSNGIQMGIDGWIYLAIGDYGFLNAKAKDGGTLHLRGGGVVRVRPDGTELELVAEGLRNIYDVAISPEVDLFTRDNTNDGGGWDVRLSHILELADYGYPRLFVNFEDEIMPAMADYGGGSPCGSLYLDESVLPAPFGTALYTCDWGRSVVYRHPLERTGATFRPGQEKFVEISRPTDMDVDGEGRIYISSWDGGQYTYAGPNVGFVVRITHEENSSAKPFPDFTSATDEVLVNAVRGSSHVRRWRAQREILRRGEKPVFEDELRRIIEESPGAGLAARVAAVFTLKLLTGAASHALLVALTEDLDLRETALRALADRASQLNGVPVEPFLKGLKDSNPRVQLQAVRGLARLGATSAAESILPLTASPDRAISHTAYQALAKLGAVETCLSALDNPQSQPVEGALRVLRQLHTSGAVAGLIRRANDTTDNALRAEILATLIRLYFVEPKWEGGWWGTRPDTSGPYYERAEWEESERIKAFVLEQLQGASPDLAARLIRELARHQVAWPEATPVMLQYAERSPEIRRAAMRMLSRQSAPSVVALDFLAATVSSEEESAELRGMAFAGLRGMEGDAAWSIVWQALPALAALDDPPREVERELNEFVRDRRLARRVDQFTALAEQDDTPVSLRELTFAVLLNQTGRRSGASDDVRVQVETFLQQASLNPRAQVSLLRAIARTRQRRYEETVRRGLASGRSEVKAAAEQAARALRMDLDPERKDAGTLLADVAFEDIASAVATTPGDPGRGRELFETQLCVSCHTTTADEPLKGPFLGGIAERYNRFELTSSILRPSAQLAQGFETHFFELKNGESVDGFVVREAGDEVEIRNAAGTPLVIAKRDIIERGTRQTSIMPEGLAANLTMQDFASLLAFLESLQSK